MRVLVTGGTGFVGRPVAAHLAGRGHDVHVASSRAGTAVAGATMHHANLLAEADRDALIRAVRPEGLVHCAWYAEAGQFWHARQNMTWLAASADLVVRFAACGGRRVVGIGSCAEYDWTAQGGAWHEQTTPLAPATIYGATKLALGQALQAFAAVSDLSAAWARLFFLFGPGEAPSRLVASVAQRVLSGEAAPCSEGSQVRDFLYVDDAAEALVALFESAAEGPVNVGSGVGVTVRELVQRVASAAGGPDLPRFGARPADAEPASIVADVSRLRDEINWHVPRGLGERIAETVAWWQARRAAKDGAAP